MAVTFEELFHDRSDVRGVRPVSRIPFVARASAGELEPAVLAAAALQIPGTYDGLVRTTIAIEEPIDNTTWRLQVTFEKYDSLYTFDTGGGSQHVTQSVLTRGRYAPAEQVAADHKGAIGVTPRGVEGVDIQVPAYHFAETHYFNDWQITPSYKLVLFYLTGCVNSDAFRGMMPGEVLFLGASGMKRGDDLWELTYRFSGLPNQLDISVGDITGITKYGWDYLWVQYEDDVDEAAQRMSQRPVAAYVEQVYPAGLFASLGIGA